MKSKSRYLNINIWKSFAVVGFVVFVLLMIYLLSIEEEKEKKIQLSEEQKLGITKILNQAYPSAGAYEIKVANDIEIIKLGNSTQQIVKASLSSSNKTAEFTFDLGTMSVVQKVQVEYYGWMTNKNLEKQQKSNNPSKWYHEEILEKIFKSRD